VQWRVRLRADALDVVEVHGDLAVGVYRELIVLAEEQILDTTLAVEDFGIVATRDTRCPVVAVIRRVDDFVDRVRGAARQAESRSVRIDVEAVRRLSAFGDGGCQEDMEGAAHAHPFAAAIQVERERPIGLVRNNGKLRSRRCTDLRRRSRRTLTRHERDHGTSEEASRHSESRQHSDLHLSCGFVDAGQMTVAACVAAVIVDESDAPVVFAWRRRSRGCAGTTSTRP